MSPWLIFTDLDGSLLDHHSYSHADADELLAKLKQLDVPVILVSSKTRAELLCLVEELALPYPFIAENGAAVFIPAETFPNKPENCHQDGGYWVKEFTHPRAYWLDLIERVRPGFVEQFVSFNEMTIEQIVEHTGLGTEDAQRAAQREYGEPIQWLGSTTDKQRFIHALEQEDACVLQGGRFLHLSGDCDKGLALTWLVEQYQNHSKQDYSSLAIGDSGNDIAMLECADHALIIRSPVHEPPTLSRSHNVTLSNAFGPAGWDQGVCQILALDQQ